MTLTSDKTEKTYQTRSNSQNNALHGWCSEMADRLNESGISIAVMFRDIEADYSMEIVKVLWRAIAKAKFGKDSTAKFTTKELQDVYEEVNRHFSKHGIEHLPFWSQEELSFKNL